ncbi:MAG: PIN domain-containing protein, partial [Caulobacteraceae bacterium]
HDHRVPDTAIDNSPSELPLHVVAFDEDQAIGAGKLRRATRGAGLSLGDRACLALARSLDATALTTDRAWEKVNGQARIELVR